MNRNIIVCVRDRAIAALSRQTSFIIRINRLERHTRWNAANRTNDIGSQWLPSARTAAATILAFLMAETLTQSICFSLKSASGNGRN